MAMEEHDLQDQHAALNLAALCSRRESETDSIKALTDAMVAGLSGTGAIEIIAQGSVAKLVGGDDAATDADVAMLDLVIEMGKQAERAKQRMEALSLQNGDGDVDMDGAENAVRVKKQPSSSPALTPAATQDGEEALAPSEGNEAAAVGKRKASGKDGFLAAEDGENRERAKRSRSR